MHIGILEDDPVQRELLVAQLVEGGHSVVACASCAQLQAALGRERLDLLLVDWVLPQGSGGRFIEWVRLHHGWHLPIVVLTASEDEQTVVRALKAGADDYVMKPTRPAELLARLGLAQSRALRQHGLPGLGDTSAPASFRGNAAS